LNQSKHSSSQSEKKQLLPKTKEKGKQKTGNMSQGSIKSPSSKDGISPI